MSLEIIDCEQLRNLFDIDIKAGRLFWRSPPKQHPRLLGIEAGCPRTNHNGKRYWVVKIGKRHYRRGRLVYLVAYGRLPHPCVDHIDGDSLNDCISNLREATITENAWNHKGRSRRIQLPMGVRRIDSSGRFQARISFHGKQLHLGAFDTSEEARSVYIAKRKELYGEFA